MNSKKDIRSIDDIFNDDDFDKLIKPLMHSKQKKTVLDPDINKLKNVEKWVAKHNRQPKNVDINDDMKERSIFHKLKGLRERTDEYYKLRPYDKLGLLFDEKDNKSNKSFNSINDVLNDDSILFKGLDNIKSKSKHSGLFKASKFIKNRTQDSNPSKKSKRRSIKYFERYKMMFNNIQKDLSSGKRKLRPFKNYDIEEGRFYVLKGQLIYIESIGEKIQKDNKNGLYKDSRVHVIYENGTEGNPLYRGLGSSLYGRGGRTISEPISNNFRLENDDIFTGYIYVLKSLSNDPQISNIDPLYKVGFTSRNVHERIANAENEYTYLYAPVKLIEQFKVININAEKLENTIHHALSKYQLNIDIKRLNGVIKPREWFMTDLSKINEVVNIVVSKLQIN